MSCDFGVIVVGSGAAGLQSAIHSSKRTKVAVFGKLEESNLWNAHVDNYLSVSIPFAGKELLVKSKQKAETLGVKFFDEDVVDINQNGDFFEVVSEKHRFSSKAVILAMGIKHKRLSVTGEREFLGRGVSYCADCDCMFFRGKKIVVIGNGSAAVRAVELLLNFASKVYFIWTDFNWLAEEKKGLLRQKGVEFIKDKLVEIGGQEVVRWVMLAERGKLEVEGVFVELGARGIYELAMQLGIELDEKAMQYVKVDKHQQTNIKGIFAAGDITGVPFQLAKAVGEGCVAGFFAGEFASLK